MSCFAAFVVVGAAPSGITAIEDKRVRAVLEWSEFTVIDSFRVLWDGVVHSPALVILHFVS